MYDTQTIHLKAKKEDVIGNSGVYPYYEKVIDDKDRIVLKYITFTHDLTKYHSKNMQESYMSYFDVKKYETHENFTKTFSILKLGKQIQVKTPNINDVTLIEFSSI